MPRKRNTKRQKSARSVEKKVPFSKVSNIGSPGMKSQTAASSFGTVAYKPGWSIQAHSRTGVDLTIRFWNQLLHDVVSDTGGGLTPTTSSYYVSPVSFGGFVKTMSLPFTHFRYRTLTFSYVGAAPTNCLGQYGFSYDPDATAYPATSAAMLAYKAYCAKCALWNTASFTVPIGVLTYDRWYYRHDYSLNEARLEAPGVFGWFLPASCGLAPTATLDIGSMFISGEIELAGMAYSTSNTLREVLNPYEFRVIAYLSPILERLSEDFKLDFKATLDKAITDWELRPPDEKDEDYSPFERALLRLLPPAPPKPDPPRSLKLLIEDLDTDIPKKPPPLKRS
jgi:hypothetical protein